MPPFHSCSILSHEDLRPLSAYTQIVHITPIDGRRQNLETDACIRNGSDDACPNGQQCVG